MASQYNRLVSTIETAVHFHLQSIEGGMERFSAVVSAEQKREGSEWPFVTVRAFEAVGASVREQTGFESITFMPFVSREDVVAWQDYSIQKASSWLSESREIAQSAAVKTIASGEYSSFVATEYLDTPPTPVLIDVTDAFEKAARGENYTYSLSVRNNPDGPYLPYWMLTPPPFSPSIINCNFLSSHHLTPPFVSAVRAARRPLLGQSVDMTAMAQQSVKFEDHERYHASLVNYTANGTKSTFQHPHCPYLFPVFDEPGNRSSAIVAMFVAVLPFDRYLVNLLPPGVGGIDAVLRNHRSNQSFTYRLAGNSVSALSASHLFTRFWFPKRRLLFHPNLF
jgi:hypothetical protein